MTAAESGGEANSEQSAGRVIGKPANEIDDLSWSWVIALCSCFKSNPGSKVGDRTFLQMSCEVLFDG